MHTLKVAGEGFMGMKTSALYYNLVNSSFENEQGKVHGSKSKSMKLKTWTCETFRRR